MFDIMHIILISPTPVPNNTSKCSQDYAVFNHSIDKLGIKEVYKKFFLVFGKAGKRLNFLLGLLLTSHWLLCYRRWEVTLH